MIFIETICFASNAIRYHWTFSTTFADEIHCKKEYGEKNINEKSKENGCALTVDESNILNEILKKWKEKFCGPVAIELDRTRIELYWIGPYKYFKRKKNQKDIAAFRRTSPTSVSH